LELGRSTGVSKGKVAGMNVLELEHVSKSFGGLRAVDDVSFAVAEKQISGLIGPNGSGKTTIFNLITGMHKLDQGRIVFEDKDISKLRPNKIHHLGAARTFQLVRPFLGMSVIDNIRVGSVFSGNPEPVADGSDEIIRFLKLATLEEKADVLARDLTLFEMKKLELARALASKPRLLLIDEFFAGLSQPQVTTGIQDIRRLNTEYGIALLIIEHNVGALMQLAKTVTVLYYGKVIAKGTPEEIAADESVIGAYLGGRHAHALRR
jgi:branched-chain amino acid transport system ATP-binding protein